MSNTINQAAPVLCVDLAIAGPIWPCLDCAPWHVEILLDSKGRPFAREWHAVGCQMLADLLEVEL